MKPLLSLVLAAFVLVSCEKSSEPDTLVKDYDEGGMDAAIARARAEVDDFLAVLEKGEADSFSVKAPITDENGTEHFWLTDISFENGQFTGAVGNDPGIVKNVEFGQPWTIKKGEISDWMFTRGEKIHGGYTIDPLLDSYPQEEAEALRTKLVR